MSKFWKKVATRSASLAILVVLTACGGSNPAGTLPQNPIGETPQASNTEQIAQLNDSVKVIANEEVKAGSASVSADGQLNLTLNTAQSLTDGDLLVVAPGNSGLSTAFTGKVVKKIDENGNAVVSLKRAALTDVFSKLKINYDSTKPINGTASQTGLVVRKIITAPGVKAKFVSAPDQGTQAGLAQQLCSLASQAGVTFSVTLGCDGSKGTLSGEISLTMDMGVTSKPRKRTQTWRAHNGTKASGAPANTEEKATAQWFATAKLSEISQKLETNLDDPTTAVLNQNEYFSTSFSGKVDFSTGIRTPDENSRFEFSLGQLFSAATGADLFDDLEWKMKSIELSGLDAGDKKGLIPIAGLVIDPECATKAAASGGGGFFPACGFMGALSDGRLKKASISPLSFILWIYIKADGTLAFEGGLDIVKMEGLTFSKGLTYTHDGGMTVRNESSTPTVSTQINGSLDAKAQFGAQMAGDVLVMGIRPAAFHFDVVKYTYQIHADGAAGYQYRPTPGWLGDACSYSESSLDTELTTLAQFKAAYDGPGWLDFEGGFQYNKSSKVVWHSGKPSRGCWTSKTLDFALDRVGKYIDNKGNIDYTLGIADYEEAGLAGKWVVSIDGGAKQDVEVDVHGKTLVSLPAGKLVKVKLTGIHEFEEENTNAAYLEAWGAGPVEAEVYSKEVTVATPKAATVGGEATDVDFGKTFQAWIINSWDTFGQVVYSFGSEVKTVAKSALDTVNQAFSVALSTAQEGVNTLVAIFQDSNGKTLGAASLKFNVLGIKTTLDSAEDNSVTPALPVAAGASTEDKTPLLRGTLSAPIPMVSGVFYSVQVFDGASETPLGEATVDGVNWSFEPTAPLSGGQHSFTAAVVRVDATPGERSKPYALTLLAPGIGAVTPSEAIRATPLTLTFTGTDLPTTGLVVTAPGNPRNTCDAPSGNTASGFTVACTFYSVGEQVLEVRRGTASTSALLASAKITVNSNVTNVTWSSASQTAPGKGTIKFGELVTYQVSGTRLMTDATMGFAVEQCGLSNAEVGSGSDALRTFQCWFNNEAGAVAGNKSLVVKDAPSGTVLYTGTVPVEVAPIDVNQSITVSWDTGAVGTSVQGRGNNPRTVAINDGVELPGFLASPAMDVDISEGKVRLSNFRGYTGAPGNAVFDASAFNGLVLRVPSGANWRFQSASVGSGNTVSGLDGSAGGAARLQNEGQFLAINLADLTYSAGSVVEVAYTRSAVAPTSTSNLPATGITANQCYGAGSNALVPCSSPAAIALSGAGKQDGMLGGALSYSALPGYSKEECVKDNATGLIWEGKTASGLRAGSNTYTNYGDGRSGDASAYVTAVNAQGLCGFNDWRLPTVDELQGIVDYSKPHPGPTVDAAWFPNTLAGVTWSSSPYAGDSSGAWGVYFYYGYVGGYLRGYGSAVRLVRASQ